ncbi:unnamed protein product, partial [Trichobilharzia regenti]
MRTLSLTEDAGPTPSDSGLQGIASALRRMTANFLEKPEVPQKQSTPRESVASAAQPSGNLLRRPSSLFNRETSNNNANNINSARNSVSDPNKNPGLLGKVENFFKSTSPNRTSQAQIDGQEANTPKTYKENDSIKPDPKIKVPKISISQQNPESNEKAQTKNTNKISDQTSKHKNPENKNKIAETEDETENKNETQEKYRHKNETNNEIKEAKEKEQNNVPPVTNSAVN